MRRFLILSAAGILSCIPDQGPVMRPGEDCLRCHNGQRAKPWTVAGTLYADPKAAVGQGVEGIAVTVTDANGKSIALISNGVGNFYTAEPLTPPFVAMIDRNGQQIAMTAHNAGGCNSCHSNPSANSAPGRLYAP